jgi:hypothetical protein
MSRPSLVVLHLIGLTLFLTGSVMIYRFMTGQPSLTDPVLEQEQDAIWANGMGVLLFSYYLAILSGAILACTSFAALFLRTRPATGR